MSPTTEQPRQPRIILVGTILALVVLALFGLSLTGVVGISWLGPGAREPSPLPAVAVNPASPVPEPSAASTVVPIPAPSAVPGASVGPQVRGAPAATFIRFPGSLQSPIVAAYLVAGAVFINFLLFFALREHRRGPTPNAHVLKPAVDLRAAIATLRHARRTRQATLSTLADRSGLPLRYLAEIEFGMRVPNREELARIRTALTVADQERVPSLTFPQTYQPVDPQSINQPDFR